MLLWKLTIKDVDALWDLVGTVHLDGHWFDLSTAMLGYYAKVLPLVN